MLDHLADLESDLSVFHRVDDMYELDGPRFFRLAWRVAAYGGMVTKQIEAQNADLSPPRASHGDLPAPSPRRSPARSEPLPVAAMAMQNPGLFEIVRAVPDPPPE